MLQYYARAFLLDPVSLFKGADMNQMTIIRWMGLMTQSLVVACGLGLESQAIAQTKDYGPGSGDFITSPKKIEGPQGSLGLLRKKRTVSNIVMFEREKHAPADALKPANR